MNRFLGVTAEILNRTQSLWNLIPPDFASPFVCTWDTAVFTVIEGKKKALQAALLALYKTPSSSVVFQDKYWSSISKFALT